MAFLLRRNKVIHRRAVFSYMIFDICRDIWIYGGGNVEDFSLLGGGNVEDLGGGNVEWITLMSPFFTDYIGTF